MYNGTLPAHIAILIKSIAAPSVIILSSLASALEPITLPRSESVVAFVASKSGEEHPVTVPDLEALGLYRITTKSPWEQGELTFEGVLFSDVVELIGFADAGALRLWALDGYSQEIPREDWVGKPLVLATRQDGNLLTRRTQGPVRLVYPLSEYPGYDPAVHDPRWIWLIKTIERVD